MPLSRSKLIHVTTKRVETAKAGHDWPVTISDQPDQGRTDNKGISEGRFIHGMDFPGNEGI